MGEIKTYSTIQAVNAVVHYYAQLAKEYHIIFDVSLPLPPDILFPIDDLCIIMGNLLENAIEACMRIQGEKRFIYLRGEFAQATLKIVLDNSFNGTIAEKEGTFYSAKRKGMGIGIKSVQSIVKRYHGLYSFDKEGHVFRVSILLPLPESKKDS